MKRENVWKAAHIFSFSFPSVKVNSHKTTKPCNEQKLAVYYSSLLPSTLLSSYCATRFPLVSELSFLRIHKKTIFSVLGIFKNENNECIYGGSKSSNLFFCKIIQTTKRAQRFRVLVHCFSVIRCTADKYKCKLQIEVMKILRNKACWIK